MDVLPAIPVPSGFELLEKLGEGAFGLVYKARQTDLDRVVAIKFIRGVVGADVDRFVQEGRAVSRLRDDRIVRVFACGTLPESPQGEALPYLVFEWVDGQTLSDWLQLEAERPLTRVIGVFRELLEGLQYAHGEGIIHRDIKPANLLLPRNGGLKIADFGLARSIEGATPLTRTGVILGTPNYMAPEQTRGEKVDSRTDLYAAGIVLYEMIAGRPPFDDANPILILQRHLKSPPPSIAPYIEGDTDKLEALVGALLAKAPGSRPPDARTVLKQLDGIHQDSVRLRSATLLSGGRRETAGAGRADATRASLPRTSSGPSIKVPQSRVRREPSRAHRQEQTIASAAEFRRPPVLRIALGLLACVGLLGWCLWAVGPRRPQSGPIGESAQSRRRPPPAPRESVITHCGEDPSMLPILDVKFHSSENTVYVHFRTPRPALVTVQIRGKSHGEDRARIQESPGVVHRVKFEGLVSSQWYLVQFLQADGAAVLVPPLPVHTWGRDGGDAQELGFMAESGGLQSNWSHTFRPLRLAGDDSNLEEVYQQMDKNPLDARGWADSLQTIASIGAPSGLAKANTALGTFRETVVDYDWEARRRALSVLEQIGNVGAADSLEHLATSPAPIGTLRANERQLRHRAAQALAMVDPVRVRQKLARWRDSPELLSIAVDADSRLCPPQLDPLVRSILSAPALHSEEVLASAVTAAGRNGGAAELLAQVIRAPGNSAAVRLPALLYLVTWGTERDVSALESELRRPAEGAAVAPPGSEAPRWVLRTAATYALAYIALRMPVDRRGGVLGTLVTQLRAPEAAVRHAALWGLTLCAQPDLAHRLESFIGNTALPEAELALALSACRSSRADEVIVRALSSLRVIDHWFAAVAARIGPPAEWARLHPMLDPKLAAARKASEATGAPGAAHMDPSASEEPEGASRLDRAWIALKKEESTLGEVDLAHGWNLIDPGCPWVPVGVAVSGHQGLSLRAKGLLGLSLTWPDEGPLEEPIPTDKNPRRIVTAQGFFDLELSLLDSACMARVGCQTIPVPSDRTSFVAQDSGPVLVKMGYAVPVRPRLTGDKKNNFNLGEIVEPGDLSLPLPETTLVPFKNHGLLLVQVSAEREHPRMGR